MKLFLFVTLLVLNQYKDFQSEAYSQPCEISKMELSVEINNFAKNSIMSDQVLSIPLHIIALNFLHSAKHEKNVWLKHTVFGYFLHSATCLLEVVNLCKILW